MIATSLALGWRLTIFAAAGVAAGISNGIAGGGTFITFPTLLALGIPAMQANVSTTVGVVPSFFGGFRLSQRTLAPHRELVRSLVLPCLGGTLTGCALLLTGSPATFRLVVPWLIGVATLVFAFAPQITRRLADLEHAHAIRRRTLFAGIFVTSAYGGYFGAGLGIMLLAVTAVTLPYEIHELQGLRNTFSMIITTVAALVFIIRGHLALDAVYMLLVGTLIGGWLGTLLIRRLSPRVVRVLVVTIGLVTTIRLALSK
jgi:uncharacterized membrane protein YfcA